jgi:hypothetical protein
VARFPIVRFSPTDFRSANDAVGAEGVPVVRCSHEKGSHGRSAETTDAFTVSRPTMEEESQLLKNEGLPDQVSRRAGPADGAHFQVEH